MGNRCFFARGNSVYLRGCGHRRSMINVLLNKIFGSKNERELKRLQPLVAEISAKEPSLARLSDLDLRAKADEFKKRLADGATLDDILTDAFAVCREMAKRKLEMRHFDVQLIGGMVLHQGKISEMKTGEGKTLVATLALYLNALEGKGAHLVTVNDYLLKRDLDYTIEEKTRTAALTEEGNEKVERALGVTNLYDLANMDLVHHVVQALRAHAMYHRDVDYVVKDGEVIIVDEFTGRLMPGRRWSEGLHQAVEAKEGVKIANENQTLASITSPTRFRH